MWNKISNAFNKSSAIRSSIDQERNSSRVDVMSSIYEQHPNLPDFRSSEVSFPSPPSPSKSLKTIFKRHKHDPAEADVDRPASPAFKLPSLQSKFKSKSSLRINTDGEFLFLKNQLVPIAVLFSIASESSSTRASQDSFVRSSQDKTPSTPFNEHHGRHGSLRSIMRDPNTPATGRSVRFFSRDAYRTISPEDSAPGNEQEELSFFARLQMNAKNTAPARSASVRPSARDVFASQVDSEGINNPISPTSTADGSKLHALNSLMMPIPPPDLSNIFDMSQEQDIPIIAPSTQSAMLENAVELSDDATAALPVTSGPSIEESLLPQGEAPSTSTPYRSSHETMYFSATEESATSISDGNSKPFTFGRPVFHPPRPGSDSPAPSLISDNRSSKSSMPASDSPSLSQSIKSHSRTLSDTVFYSMLRSASNSFKDTSEAVINDTSNPLVVYSSSNPEPDPFRANATTYYTPGTMMPPTPPQPTHTRKASREEDMIWSLRTQLALQQDLCAQYEIDLHARDELVNALNEKLDSAEKDKQHRSGVLRGWKKKVQELERMCRGLEEQVDRSRQDSLERSVMDEASSDALRELHRVIGRLEREKADVERREMDEKGRHDIEVDKLQAELKRREESEVQLREGIKNAKEQMEITGKPDEQDDGVVWKAANEEERQRYRVAELEWAEERGTLIAKINDLEQQTIELLAGVQDSEKKISEYNRLKDELEAQWKQTETMTEKITNLEKERDELRTEITHMEKRIADIEVEWNESENRKAHLEGEFQNIMSAKFAVCLVIIRQVKC
jgi:hypothetical protein